MCRRCSMEKGLKYWALHIEKKADYPTKDNITEKYGTRDDHQFTSAHLPWSTHTSKWEVLYIKWSRTTSQLMDLTNDSLSTRNQNGNTETKTRRHELKSSLPKETTLNWPWRGHGKTREKEKPRLQGEHEADMQRMTRIKKKKSHSSKMKAKGLAAFAVLPRTNNTFYNWVLLETVGINVFLPELLHMGFFPY